MMRIADVFLTIPGLPLVIVIASIIRTSVPSCWPRSSR